MNWVKIIIDQVIYKFFGYTEIEFEWKDEKQVDPLIQAQIDDINIKNGKKSIDEVRMEAGLEPIGLGNAIYGAMGVTLVKDIIERSELGLDIYPTQNDPKKLEPEEKGSAQNIPSDKTETTTKLEKAKKKRLY